MKWEDAPVTMSADEAMAALAGSPEGRNALEEAKQLLLEVLPEGPKEIKRQAEEAGIHWSTVRRAKELLRVEACREGGIASQGRWIWRLTRKPKVPIPEFEHLSNLSEEKWRKTPKVPKVPKVEDEHLSEPLMDEEAAFEERAAIFEYDGGQN